MEKARLQCVSLDEYQNRMLRVYESGDDTDVTLICSDGITFKAHKFILRAQSDFFSKAFQPDKYLEGNSGQVNLKIGDSDVIAQLLKYIYTLEYDSSAVETEASWRDVKLYAAADFYMVSALKIMARKRFEQSAAKLLSTSTSQGLKELSNIISFIYENTIDESGSDLRETAVKVFISHNATADVSDEESKYLRKIMDESGAFGRDLGIAMLTKWKGFRKFQCPHCIYIWADLQQPYPIQCPRCRESKECWDAYQVE